MLRITSSTSEDGYHLQIDESEQNITKRLFSYGKSIASSDSQDEEERDQQNMQIDSDVEDYPPQTFHHVLPRVENVIAHSKWRNEKEPDSKDDCNKNMVSKLKLFLTLKTTLNYTRSRKNVSTKLGKISKPYIGAMRIRMAMSPKLLLKTSSKLL